MTNIQIITSEHFSCESLSQTLHLQFNDILVTYKKDSIIVASIYISLF